MPRRIRHVKIDKARPYIDAFVQYCLQFGIGQGGGQEGTMEVLDSLIFYLRSHDGEDVEVLDPNAVPSENHANKIIRVQLRFYFMHFRNPPHWFRGGRVGTEEMKHGD
jgi:hypothetical protein